ncbi:deoxynucleoside-5 [Klebsiella phage vB_KpnP_FZ12]|uniref:Deoxynucleoside-5 n=1 Tax=Klebsiella phage vB_KpnP_FZ12 TaxID=2530031 RepID=A0A4D6T3Q8_9CAUD|nr:deoxynucleoside-5 [Klebsiella phage vB_KpnP_FZ12]
MKPIDRFNSKVKPKGSCLEWQASRFSSGYGQFFADGKNHRAHRWLYEHVKGKLSDGLVVRHTCDNPACVNIEHLEVGTQQDNINDKVRRGRQLRGENHGRALLTREDAEHIRESDETRRELAKRFSVSEGCINNIKLRRTWK